MTGLKVGQYVMTVGMENRRDGGPLYQLGVVMPQREAHHAVVLVFGERVPQLWHAQNRKKTVADLKAYPDWCTLDLGDHAVDVSQLR